MLQTQISVLSTIHPRVVVGTSAEGAFLYILAKLSTRKCAAKQLAMDICVAIDEEEALRDSEGGSSSTPLKSLSASLTRPKSVAQMHSLLHSFVWMCCATGLTNLMAIAPFLDEVIYEPLRLQTVPWQVAFEMMVLYIQMVEADPQRWNIASVVSKSGSMDSKRHDAYVQASAHHPSANFRALRGEPRDVDNGEPSGADSKKYYSGPVTSFDDTCTKACISWNAGTKHYASNVSNGKCKFFHGCSQWVCASCAQ